MQPIIISINRKIKFLICVIFLCLSTVIIRLYQLQVIETRNLYNISQKNFTRIEKVPPPRGNILDAHGRLLATNRPVTNIYWHGSNKPTIDDQQLKMLSIIDATIGTDYLNSSSLVTLKIIERQGKRMPLGYDLSFEQLSKIAEQIPDSENVCFVTHFKRHYPYGPLASHLLGYLGHINYEPSGQMGLEKVLDDTLRGDDGSIMKIINSLGKNLAIKELKHASAGQDITTTLDLDLQQMAERLFPQEYAGTLVLMDPRSGAIKALVSRPDFDPNIFLNSIDHDQWHELESKKVFLNRAFNASYPPASIFKLVTMSAALEKHIIEPDSIIYCRGYYKFGSSQHWCKNHTGHGELTVKEALAKSCNILFYHIGKQLSIDVLADYAHRFGLGEKANMLFANSQGLIPTSQWKRIAKGERWWPGETLSAAIGQSFLLTTPIQIARMISSIFEGYLVTPRLLEVENIEKSPLEVSRSTREFLKDSMHWAVKSGTAISLSRLVDFELYAKTGTAQTSSLALREKTNKYLEHAWFVTYFKCKNQPPLTMVVLVEEAADSRVATAIARKFLIEYRHHLEAAAPAA